MTQFISTTIPYVNGAPHIGHAQEFVLADALRRYYGDVHFQSGADENSLKNVLAAEAAGLDTAAYVAARADEFECHGSWIPRRSVRLPPRRAPGSPVATRAAA